MGRVGGFYFTTFISQERLLMAILFLSTEGVSFKANYFTFKYDFQVNKHQGHSMEK
jgi:hypothetical protein